MTLRQIWDIYWGKQRSEWNHTSAILAMLANVNKDPKKGKPVDPRSLHPMEAVALRGQPQGLPVNRETMPDLLAMFNISPQQIAEAQARAEAAKNR